MERQSMLFRRISALTAAVTLCIVAPAARAETFLIMAEETGCMWCAMWDRQIAPIYPKTPEGRAAPWKKINIHGELPDDVVLTGRITYTPTFILVDEGREVSRIEGYPGEDFFWGLLGKMLKEAGIDHDKSG
jgi:hypothetical protein